MSAPETEDTFVYGLARFDAIDAEVMLNVDPELDEHPEHDLTELAAQSERALAISVTDWQALLDRIVADVEEAEDAEPADEETTLRDDLALRSMIVFADAVLLSFDAPKQFPDSEIRVQLGTDLAFEYVEVETDDDDGAETITFESVDALMNHLSA